MREQSETPGAAAWRSPLLPPAVDPVSQGEMAQARIRLLGALGLLVVFAVLQVWGRWGVWDRALTDLVLYLPVCLAWTWVVRRRWGQQGMRLRTAVLIEQSFYALFLAHAQEQAGWLLGVPMLSSLGHGLRFGPRMAVFSACVGSALLALAVTHSPYWLSLPEVSLGLVLATLTVPVYAAVLGRRLHADRSEAERRAAVWEEASKTDALTGLSNRVGLLDALDRVFASQRQAARICALFYTDLDGFKAINDAAGHAAGDEVLRQVAQVLRDSVRGDDVVARLGGDEFAIVAFGLCTPDDARLVAVKVMHALDQIRVPGHEGLRVGCSLGVCLLPDPALTTPSQAISAADELMLQVKRTGKGNVRVRGEPAQVMRA